jgi:hypothetical protein
VLCSVFTEYVTGISSGGLTNHFCTLPSAPVVEFSLFIYMLEVHYRVGTGKEKIQTKQRTGNIKGNYQVAR